MSPLKFSSAASRSIEGVFLPAPGHQSFPYVRRRKSSLDFLSNSCGRFSHARGVELLLHRPALEWAASRRRRFLLFLSSAARRACARPFLVACNSGMLSRVVLLEVADWRLSWCRSPALPEDRQCWHRSLSPTISRRGQRHRQQASQQHCVGPLL
jgi:hypothetical protein